MTSSSFAPSLIHQLEGRGLRLYVSPECCLMYSLRTDGSDLPWLLVENIRSSASRRFPGEGMRFRRSSIVNSCGDAARSDVVARPEFGSRRDGRLSTATRRPLLPVVPGLPMLMRSWGLWATPLVPSDLPHTAAAVEPPIETARFDRDVMATDNLFPLLHLRLIGGGCAASLKELQFSRNGE